MRSSIYRGNSSYITPWHLKALLDKKYSEFSKVMAKKEEDLVATGILPVILNRQAGSLSQPAYIRQWAPLLACPAVFPIVILKKFFLN